MKSLSVTLVIYIKLIDFTVRGSTSNSAIQSFNIERPWFATFWYYVHRWNPELDTWRSVSSLLSFKNYCVKVLTRQLQISFFPAVNGSWHFLFFFFCLIYLKDVQHSAHTVNIISIKNDSSNCSWATRHLDIYKSSNKIAFFQVALQKIPFDLYGLA